MVKGVNKVILIGNLGINPVLKHTANGNPVINLSVATTTSWKDVATSTFSEKTEWHRVVIYNKLANALEKYLRKGVKVYVEGFLRTNKWTDNTGVVRYSTEIVANTLLLLSSRDDTKKELSKEKDSVEFFDDDLPF